MTRYLIPALALLAGTSPAASQSVDRLSAATRRYVAVAEPVVALTNVTVIDGTGSAPRPAEMTSRL